MNNKNNFDIKRFLVRNFRRDTTIAIIGTRGSGKTVIIKYFLYYNHKRIRIPMLISATAQLEGDFKGVLPDLFIYENYDPDKIQLLINDQMQVKKKYENGIVNPRIKKHSVLIMDDIVGTDKIWKKDKGFKNTFFAGRHYWLSNIVSVQTPMQIPPEYRDNIDYVIVTSITTDKRKRSLYDNFWDSRYGTYKEFNTVFKKILSKKYNFMVIDNYRSKKGECDSIKDYVFWGRTHHPRYIKARKVGIKAIWDINTKFFDRDYMMNHSLTKKGKQPILIDDVYVSSDKENDIISIV